MIDRLIEMGSMFDWITPSVAYVQDLIHGPSVTFTVPLLGSGWSGRQIETLLSERGVQVWGLLAVGDTLVFTVKQVQAEWTRYLLEERGIPLGAGTLQGAVPSQPSSGILAALDEWMRALGDMLLGLFPQAKSATHARRWPQDSKRAETLQPPTAYSTTIRVIGSTRDQENHSTATGPETLSALSRGEDHGIVNVHHSSAPVSPRRNGHEQNPSGAHPVVRELLSGAGEASDGMESKQRRTII